MEDNKKISYEELEKLAKHLSDKCAYLEQKLGEANLSNVFQRLNYLFKVAENHKVFSTEFISKVVLEIEDLLTIEDTKKEE